MAASKRRRSCEAETIRLPSPQPPSSSPNIWRLTPVTTVNFVMDPNVPTVKRSIRRRLLGRRTTATSSRTEPSSPTKRELGLVCLTPDLGDGQIDSRFPDVIAIHGLGGDLQKTWTHENGALWLRDFLPRSIKVARVFSFGYDAEVVLTKSKAKLDDFARSLLNNLQVARNGEALITARLEPEDEFSLEHSSIKGIFFLGTPHHGSGSASWAKMLTGILGIGLYVCAGLIGSPRTDLLRDLEQDSDTLKSISTDFRNLAKNIKIYSCIEQHSTPPLTRRIVDQHTGVLDIPGEVIITMDGCDHRTMCRFSDEKDPNYRVIQSRIKQLIA